MDFYFQSNLSKAFCHNQLYYPISIGKQVLNLAP